MMANGLPLHQLGRIWISSGPHQPHESAADRLISLTNPSYNTKSSERIQDKELVCGSMTSQLSDPFLTAMTLYKAAVVIML